MKFTSNTSTCNNTSNTKTFIRTKVFSLHTLPSLKIMKSCLFLYPLKTSENLWFSDALRVNRKKSVSCDKLNARFEIRRQDFYDINYQLPRYQISSKKSQKI